ncbi:MAG: hypothetical protein IH971_04645 [Candidatus Marinimicrobia bacterium]|nr:hypothetical protein [Candidatus Neomarinimicrobiota bacterium]
MTRHRLILPLLVLLASGCTYTRVTGFIDPGSRPGSFRRLAVYARLDDLSDRQAIEVRLVEQLRSKGISAVTLLSLAPPTREITPEELAAVLRVQAIDGIVEIVVAETGYLAVAEPLSSETETFTREGRDGKKHGVTRTTISGGGTQYKAYGKLRVSLKDTATGQNAWVGDADSRAFFSTFNPDWDMSILLKAFARKTASELIKTGLLQSGG